MKGSEIHFAVAGFGHIGKRHAEMIRLNPQARLVAVCDVVPANEVNGLPEGVLYYTNYNQMLAECKSVEVVNICVPNGLHRITSYNVCYTKLLRNDLLQESTLATTNRRCVDLHSIIARNQPAKSKSTSG